MKTKSMLVVLFYLFAMYVHGALQTSSAGKYYTSRVPSLCSRVFRRHSQTVADAIPMQPRVISARSVLEASKQFRDEFRRYKHLKEFMDGEIQWEDMHSLVALCLGFRADDAEQTLTQTASLAPVGWKYLSEFPDFSDLANASLEKKLLADLPEDPAATDIVMEQMVGLEMYKMLCADGDAQVQRRLLLGKWLYVRGLFHDVFPHQEAFVPGHLRDPDDDE